MAHRAKVLLNCDIEYRNKIIFENRQVWFYADVELSNIEYEDGCFSGCSIDLWDSDDELARADRNGYLYAVNMNEWCSDKEVEDFDGNIQYGEFTLLVKNEEYDDLELDYGMFEPDDNYEG